MQGQVLGGIESGLKYIGTLIGGMGSAIWDLALPLAEPEPKKGKLIEQI
jgi:hypothetical protein